MKNSIKVIFTAIFFILTASMLQAQNNTNHLTCDDYEAITFNGKTIEQINATNADPQNVQQLLGNYSSVNELGENRSRTLYYGENRIGFTYDVQTYVTRITITNDQWPVVIQGNTVKVGDTVASLKQAFGDDLIIGQSQYVSYSFVAFGCSEKDTGINLKIDPDTNSVTEIVYFVSP